MLGGRTDHSLVFLMINVTEEHFSLLEYPMVSLAFLLDYVL